MTTRDLVDMLGGYRELAAALGLDFHRVHNWLSRGIPSAQWHAVVRLAQSRGGEVAQAVTFDALEIAHRRSRPARDIANGRSVSAAAA